MQKHRKQKFSDIKGTLCDDGWREGVMETPEGFRVDKSPAGNWYIVELGTRPIGGDGGCLLNPKTDLPIFRSKADVHRALRNLHDPFWRKTRHTWIFP